MDVKLGTGLATGMFYHAPAGTALPSSLLTDIPSTWTHVGDVSDAGITLALNKSVTHLRNWANVVKRSIVTEHTETIQSPIMDTTPEVFETVFGAGSVQVLGQNGAEVYLSGNNLPDQEAYLWVMKDGNDMMAIGCSYGQVTAIENVSFAPGAAINWSPTITAQGEGFQLILED